MEGDKASLQTLFEESFPLRYEPRFYDNAVAGRTLSGSPGLYSRIALGQDGRLLAALTADLRSGRRGRDMPLLSRRCAHKTAFYIQTLAVKTEARRHGLASRLVRAVIDSARQRPDCGAVYLHVIHYNAAAIRLYKRLGFQQLRKLPGYYLIGGIEYDAFLYALHINGGMPPESCFAEAAARLSALFKAARRLLKRLFCAARSSHSPSRHHRRVRAV